MKESIFLVLSLFIVSKAEGSGQRIVGGQQAPAEFGKFHASLQNLTSYHVCGGAIISEKHVLTAAHCVYGAEPQYIRVVVGTTNLGVGGITYELDSITIHSLFNITSKANDIALLKINDVFDLKRVEYLEMYQPTLVEGDIVQLTGFGAIDVSNISSSSQMQSLSLPVFNQEICKYAMRYATRKVTDSNFCTFTHIGEGTCYGDSGGPLVMNGLLVGLVSWGIPCAAGFPDVHTRITPYIPWIHEELTKSAY